jgi:DNA-binding NarL/FixJ family response regulator
MSSSFDHTVPSWHERSWVPERVAVAVDDVDDRDGVLASLAAGGLAATGEITLGRLDEILADPPGALVLVTEISQGWLTALRRVRREAPRTRVVVVAQAGTPAPSLAARQALNAGADAFVHEADIGRSLAVAVRAVMAGLVCVPYDARRLIAKPTFSHREKEILGLVVAGLTNREIAGRLYLAESTVKTHLASAFAKLGVGSRKDAAALLLDPAEGLAATALPAAPGVQAAG